MTDPLSLPQDVILLICQELSACRDFATLFRCSLVSHRVAIIALEQLYRIEGDVPESFRDNKTPMARLWRSIILSSVGKTAYPYCTYIRALSLGDLEESLEDARSNQDVRRFYLGPDMQRFLVPRYKEDDMTDLLNARRVPISIRPTMINCANTITKYIKDSAEHNEKAVALAHLEGYFIPHDILPRWVARLGTLTSLRLRDGSVLGVETASALSKYCPKFSELTCYYYQSGNADEDMAAFLQTLRPNSLQRFEIISKNGIAQNTLAALNLHAESLKTLILGSLTPSAITNLNALPQCTKLECLVIENDFHYQVPRRLDSNLTHEIAVWIGNCKSLRELTFRHVQDALGIVEEVMTTPGIHLTSLVIQGFRLTSPALSQAAWIALAKQRSLESLTLESIPGEEDNFQMMEGLVLEFQPPLTESICLLTNLTYLNLMQAHVSVEEIGQFSCALSRLEDFAFGGELVDDSVLEILGTFPALKALSVNANSMFTWESLRTFALGLNSPGHKGFKLEVMAQVAGAKLSNEQEKWLEDYFIHTLGGRFSMTYPLGLDEYHEGDFSESE
ncbi:hypothetical protein F4775DRAFT_559755 [Biscogniauxia sp. FL1348]|nr:hypothetical protein F4775DRAFT_559755 [Biscogniauxia sp. FL1348]